MSRSWLLYIDDLVASGEKIARFVSSTTMESFSSDEAIFDAILFNLQIIGEAIKKLPEDVRESVPELSGPGPARLRDLIAHHYFAVDPSIIWGVATQHVPVLLAAARELHDREEGKRVVDEGNNR